MHDYRPFAKAIAQPAPRRNGGDFGEVILVSLTTVLGILWAIVLVTHFHGTLSGFGQSLWLMR